jgi:hypothetical protein
MMFCVRLLCVLLLASGFSGALAGTPPKRLTTALIESRNEAACPSFSAQVRATQRITGLLADALVLTIAQKRAVEACTLAERIDLALAPTDPAAALVRQQYLVALCRVLTPTQRTAYVAMRQQLAGTLLPLDGTEVAVR